MDLFRLRFVVVGIPLLLAATASAAPVPAPDLAAAQLRSINHRYVNAFVQADPVFMEALTHTDFLLTDNDGAWLTRDQHLNAMGKAAITTGVSYDAVQVRLIGPVALLHGVFEAGSDTGTTRRVRYTDVYYWDGADWRLVSAQNTPIRDGVATTLRHGNAPQHASWQGHDPHGAEFDVLRELNANYVKAFREADVAWYDAHLAPDYVVINGDGSIDDRAQALHEFAQPVFAEYFRSFPVDQVRIRRFGNLALIHAENAYTLKDGRTGVSRYTDIWQQQADGRWQCIAAHITRYKEPSE